MNFLNPAAWWALALAVPVIALYLVKSRLRERTVSTLLFWEAVGPRLQTSPLWRKLRRWLSLALQLLFLGLLVFALLRPSPPWLSKEAEARVIVLDVSPSMGAMSWRGSERWEAALAAAEREIAALRAFDEAALVAASQPPRLVCGWTSSGRRLREALRSVRPEAKDVPVGPALELAKNLAASREHGKVVLVSDGVWTAPLAAEECKGVRIEPVEEAKPGAFDNAGLVRFSVRRSLAAPGDYEVLAEAARSAPKGAAEASYELELRRDGKTIDVQAVRLPPGGSWQRSWPGRGEGRAVFEAVLRPAGRPTEAEDNADAGDALAADDRAEAGLAALSPVEVVRAGQPFAFLDAALASLPNVRVLTAAEAQADPVKTRLWFYCGDPPAGFEQERAKDSVVLLYPSGSGFWGTAGETVEQPLVTEWERGHAVMRFLEFEQVRFTRARAMAPPPGADVLLKSFETPLIYGEWPRWLVLAFDPERSDLVFRTAFPILLGNLVQSLRDDTRAQSAELPGKSETQGLVRLPEAAAAAGTASGSGAWLWAWAALPLWSLALLLGVAWIFTEWRLFHWKVTE